MGNIKYRIGIIGTGRIAHRFVPEVQTIDGIEIKAVYNPRMTSANEFAAEFGISFATDKLEQFIEEVDLVYIATPHETHADYCRQMLTAGKHVLCEKPLCFSQAEAQALFALAKEKNCILMEAIKTAYCPGFLKLLEIIKSGIIGDVVDVEACFSRLSNSNVREVWDIAYGGSFTEFGTYSLLPIVKLLGTKHKAQNIWSRQAKTGVDAYTKMMFDYERAVATAKTGLCVKSEGQLVIAGTKGYILVPSPWWLTKYFEVRYEDPAKKDIYEFSYEGSGLRYEIQAWIDRIQGIDVVKGISEEESIWFAEQMESFLESQWERQDDGGRLKTSWGTQTVRRKDSATEHFEIGIWAHRGCSLAYPENTLSAFQAAAELNGITGIELDVQLTSDSEIVVIHDETVDRTTNGKGMVCDFSLEEIQKLEIVSDVKDTGSLLRDTEKTEKKVERIPTMREVFELLKPYCKGKDLLINIELKNSNIRYEGMEQQLLELVKEYELQNYIVYSSFLPESMGMLKQLDPTVKTGILGMNVAWCTQKAFEMNADAIHPWIGGLELVGSENAGLVVNKEEIAERKETHVNGRKNQVYFPVGVWNMEEPFFGQNRVLKEKNMTKYGVLGATDIITNVPELYLKKE